MWAIFLQTLPFFGLIGAGYGAGRSGFFPEEATAWLTRFVFYFALSAMLFRFSANLSLAQVLDWQLVLAYLAGTASVYLLATLVAALRRRPVAEAAVEAQCAVIGNVGFLGIPMLALLLGERAIGPLMLVLAVDLIVFGSLIVILVTGSRGGRFRPAIVGNVLLGLLKNPMIVSIAAGLAWSALRLPVPGPLQQFLVLLGSAATPGALFAIGASLASKSAERLSVALWLSSAKLLLHPAAVAISAVWLAVEPFAAGVMVACAALPVAGNVYILAQHYMVAPQRASAAILVSTALSVVTVAAWIAWIGT
ncbi:AEC family transporter [Roseitranquillus sediminis]|uniref:AEC family transporter n=1 Tax=Roseitranquillus sediminis TaxID=2809051 RepID=UPI001D0C1503|nr:AEC family transporter [Roseitranquillus sediminis]MBM9593219.1 AEC family transporter [Roseitranquillus sediminis]